MNGEAGFGEGIVGAGLHRDACAPECQADRGDAIASQPAPTAKVCRAYRLSRIDKSTAFTSLVIAPMEM